RDRWRLASLVVDDRDGAVGPDIDAISLGAELEFALWNIVGTDNLADDSYAFLAPLAFEFEEPASHAFEARPPKCLDAGTREYFSEGRDAGFAQCFEGDLIVRQQLWIFLGEEIERAVDRFAAFSCGRCVVERFELPQLQDRAGVERVGIADPALDIGDP